MPSTKDAVGQSMCSDWLVQNGHMIGICIPVDYWAWHSQRHLQSAQITVPVLSSLFQTASNLLSISLAPETSVGKLETRKANEESNCLSPRCSCDSVCANYPLFFRSSLYLNVGKLLARKCGKLQGIAIDVTLHYCRCAGSHCLACCSEEGRPSPAKPQIANVHLDLRADWK